MKIKRRTVKGDTSGKKKGKRKKKLGRSDPKKPNFLLIAKRQIKALEMRADGETYQTIADECGVSVKQAYTDVQKAINKVNKEQTEKVEQLRTLELARLDKLIRQLESGHKKKTVTVIVGKGKNKRAMKISQREIDTVSYVYAYIKLMDRRARYIMGLDVPREAKFDVGDNLKDQMETASAGLLDTLKQLAGEEK